MDGWLYELDYSARPRRPRRATAAERDASDDTHYVNGTGIFVLLGDNTIVRSDSPNYPTASALAVTWWPKIDPGRELA